MKEKPVTQLEIEITEEEIAEYKERVAQFLN